MSLSIPIFQRFLTPFLIGEAEIKAAKAEGYAKGTAERVEGKSKSVLGAVTGDKSKQAEG